MITLISRPEGYKLIDTELDAIVGTDGGDALVTTDFAHALQDGDVVFIQGPIESYNGFKIVDQIAYNSFKIKNSENESAVEYIQDATITYKVSVLEHGFQCVHLPIVYELESDLSPSNTGEEAYTPVTIDSQEDSEGQTILNLSTGISGLTELNWIALIGDGDLEGAYQIIEVLSAWRIVIDLAYDSTRSFAGYQVVNYYKNYCINVDVYAGLPSTHRWASIKPYELAGTLRFTPDENNRVKFSINELLRGYINVRNNLTLDTLPNNLDFMVAFYIIYYESYDFSSDGETIVTFNGSETIDDFTGYALNSKLPFKFGSFMSDYVTESGYLANWLVLQPDPIAIVGRFFDLSFINQFAGVDIHIFQNGVQIQTIVNPGIGILRIPLEWDTAGEYCIYAYTPGKASSGGPPATSLEALSGWENSLPGGWTTSSTPDISINGNGGIPPGWLQGDFVTAAGFDYEFSVQLEILVTGASAPIVEVIWAIMNGSTVVDSITFNYNTSGVKNETFTLHASTATALFGIFITNNTPVDTKSFELQDATYNAPAPVDDSIPAQIITEEICITVLEECDDTLINSDDARLLEDGDFRLLE